MGWAAAKGSSFEHPPCGGPPSTESSKKSAAACKSGGYTSSAGRGNMTGVSLYRYVGVGCGLFPFQRWEGVPTYSYLVGFDITLMGNHATSCLDGSVAKH